VVDVADGAHIHVRLVSFKFCLCHDGCLLSGSEKS
jgi:hypothetical protein